MLRKKATLEKFDAIPSSYNTENWNEHLTSQRQVARLILEVLLDVQDQIQLMRIKGKNND